MNHYAEVEKNTSLKLQRLAKTETHTIWQRRIETLNEEIKALSTENEKLKAKMANASVGDAL